MSPARFVAALAWRETRGSRRMLLLLLLAIATGVAALVAIRGFADQVRASVREQAQALLGADLVAGSARPFSPEAERHFHRLAQEAGAQAARVISFGAMAFVPGREASRLVQVLAVEPGYPFYGDVRTEPPGAWSTLGSDGTTRALADDALAILLDAKAGDVLSIGDARLTLSGSVKNFPGDVGVRTSLGPRVFVPLGAAERTGLLGFGARARYELFLRLPPSADPQRIVDRFRPLLARERVSLRTVAEDQRRLSDNLGRLGRYLGLVGLIALLLGGIGVASAVHVLVRRRLQTIAVLRCLGASSRRVFAVYLLQALGLGLLGSSLGAALGVLAQKALPRLLGGFLPVAAAAGVSWSAVASGLLTGAAASLFFALYPLLSVRRVPPLLALRRDVEPQPAAARRDRGVAALATSGGVLLIASLEAGGIRTGAAFAAGLGLALGALWLAAGALRAGLRRGVSPRLPYTWRQGLANLYRPANQTLAVALSLGFGAFLLGTLLALQSNLLRELRTGEGPRSNLAFFDIQPDQLESVVAELKQNGADPGRPVPIVPMRIDSVKGIPASQKLAQAAAGAPQRSPAWLLRREFRSTYRAQKTPTEELTAGAWWSPDAQDAEVVPVSLEVEMAKDLGVAVGDEIVWDVQGVLLKSRVANLRRVEWARFEPNFFAVFPDGPLRAAPQSFVTLLRIDDGAARARLMRLLSERFSNISALDLADIQKNLEELLAKLAWAVRFLAMFSVATGTLVLLGALAASRLERLREAVLLKTLGATRRQVARVILAEYAALGVLAGATGVLLAGAASWALVRFLFESSFSLPTLPLLGFGAGVVALTLALGASGSIEVFRKTSLELLRNE